MMTSLALYTLFATKRRLVSITAAGVLLGCGLARAGYREREGGTWHCPKCEHNLQGQKYGPCPKCGTLISRETALLGHRKPQWAVVLVGVAMAAASLLAGVGLLLAL